MSAPDKQMIERVDNECAICGKTRSQHPTNSGVGMCQIYPIFVSKRDMLNRLSAITPPNGDEAREALVKCRDKFAEYVELHKAKLLPERAPGEFYQHARTSHNRDVREKMQRNQEMVALCNAALAKEKRG